MEFPGNPMLEQKEPEEPKKVEKVVEGTVIRRKRPWYKKVSEIFIGGDSRTVGQYLFYDVFLPATKDTIADLMSQGVERMLFGEVKSTSRRPGGFRRGSPNGYVSYNRYAVQTPPWERDKTERYSPTRKARANHELDEYIIDTRVEAEEVLNQLFNIISRYESATVADFYELIGVNANYTDDKWGWTDIRGSDVTRTTRGYLINLPRPEPLD